MKSPTQKKVRKVKGYAVIMRDDRTFLRAYRCKEWAKNDVGPAVFTKIVPCTITFNTK